MYDVEREHSTFLLIRLQTEIQEYNRVKIPLQSSALIGSLI